MTHSRIAVPLVLMTCAAIALSACGRQKGPKIRFSSKDTECMARAMYFESIQSSRDGLIAVGSVVMNRVESEAFPNTVCGVVSQKGQFAPGVMTRKMGDRWGDFAREAAKDVLAGQRHPAVTDAKYFHAASYRAGYNNMHYVVTTGGNAFYERRRPADVTQPKPLAPTEGVTG